MWSLMSLLTVRKLWMSLNTFEWEIRRETKTDPTEKSTPKRNPTFSRDSWRNILDANGGERVKRRGEERERERDGQLWFLSYSLLTYLYIIHLLTYFSKISEQIFVLVCLFVIFFLFSVISIELEQERVWNRIRLKRAMEIGWINSLDSFDSFHLNCVFHLETISAADMFLSSFIL